MEFLQNIIGNPHNHLPIVMGVSVLFTLAIVILGKFITKIPFRRMFLLMIYGMLVFLIIKFLEHSIGRTEDFNLFFFTVEITGNDFIESFKTTVEGGISSLESFSLEQPVDGKFGNWILLFWIRIREIGALTISVILLSVILEEVGKLVMFIVFRRSTPYVTNIASSLYYMTFIALGFAAIENIYYIQLFYQNNAPSFQAFLQWSMIRNFAGITSHVFFSTLFAYFYARGVFAGFAMADRKTSKQINKSMYMLKMFGIWGKRSLHTAYLGKMLLIGGVFSVGTHLVYNMLHTFSQSLQDGRYTMFALLFVTLGVITFFLIVIGENRNRYHYSLIQKKIQMAKKLKEIRDYYS